jgi:hypothetical protein
MTAVIWALHRTEQNSTVQCDTVGTVQCDTVGTVQCDTVGTVQCDTVGTVRYTAQCSVLQGRYNTVYHSYGTVLIRIYTC